MTSTSVPKHLKDIECKVNEKLKLIQAQPCSELFQTQQLYHDEIYEVYQEAFLNLIDSTVTYSKILQGIKNAYENALHIRDKRIAQYITQDKVFGISVQKKQRDDKIKNLLKETEDLKEQNLKFTHEVSKLKKDMGKLQDDRFSDYLTLMRERDARYTLYFENLGLQMKLKELDGSSYPVDDAYGDPVVLRIALDRCREQLSSTQNELKNKTEQYAETVPRRQHDILEARHYQLGKEVEALKTEVQALLDGQKRLQAQKRSVEEELSECRERCGELERAGSPRPHWDMCADFISGGRDRWWQLASGLSSRDILRVLLKELGPAAESENMEHFDGLGMDPVVPAYLRYEGKVRNLRLSRRELAVLLHDIWRGKAARHDLTLHDYVTLYFEERYQQPSMRAEWAYNMCASAEQMLDEPQVKLFWGVLHGHLSEDIYWGLGQQWRDLKHQLYRNSKDKETITIDEFEKTAKALFPLKSEVDIKNLSDVLRKQLKLKTTSSEVNLEKLFQENDECFDRVELSRELFRQRQLAQDKYIREILAQLGAAPRQLGAVPAQHGAAPRQLGAGPALHGAGGAGPRAAPRLVSVEALKRAIALVDPAIDHIRMERYIRWSFSEPVADLSGVGPLPLRSVAARLAAGDIERVGPRYRGSQRRTYK